MARGHSNLFFDRVQAPADPYEAGAGEVLPGGLGGGVESTAAEYDDETLGGFIKYYILIEPTRYIDGELEQLTIRYNPTSPPPPIPVDAVQPDT